MKEQIIYSRKLALYLRERHFKLLRTGINPNFPQYITYIFAYAPGLEEAIQEYSAN